MADECCGGLGRKALGEPGVAHVLILEDLDGDGATDDTPSAAFHTSPIPPTAILELSS